MQVLQMLQSLDPKAQTAIAGAIAWLLTQVIKSIWKPPAELKLKKLLVAIVMAGVTALSTEFGGVGGFMTQWAMTAASAIGLHEATDKFGLQQLLKRNKPYNRDEAGKL